MVYEYTPLHAAAYHGHAKSVKMILDCLTAEQQILIMSVQRCRGETAIQLAERGGHTDTVRVLTECHQRVEKLQRQQGQSRLRKALSGTKVTKLLCISQIMV